MLWLLELKAGVFVGKITSRVREFLWNEIKDNQDKFNGALLVYESNNEQGYKFDTLGQTHRSMTNIEGLQLIKVLRREGYWN